MKSLITADLHLGDDTRNEYRWTFLELLPKLCNTHLVGNLFILGDIFTSKDYHSSKSINRFLDVMSILIGDGTSITILMGNHDYVDINTPFFNFLNCIDYISFIKEPKDFDDWLLLVPHSTFNEGLLENKYDFIFTHDDFVGTRYENGHLVDGGIDPTLLSNYEVISGHVHVPQNVTHNISYVGSPYPIIFEQPDTLSVFRRVILLEDSNVSYLPCALFNKFKFVFEAKDFDTLDSKFFLHCNTTLQTQVRTELQLRPNEFHYFNEIKKSIKDLCKKYNVEFCGCLVKKLAPEKRIRKRKLLKGVSTTDIFEQYSRREAIKDDVKDIGKKLLEDKDA